MNKKIIIIILILAVLIALFFMYLKPRSGVQDVIFPPNNTYPNSTSALGNVKVAIVYEKLADKMQSNIGRNINTVTGLINATGADMIFRGWWREFPTPESCGQLPSNMKSKCEDGSQSYEYFKSAVSQIKLQDSNIIIIGGAMAQRLNKDMLNSITGEISGGDITYPETWDMALDPAKWGITSVSKIKLQCEIAERLGYMGTNADCAAYNPEKADAYLPDITNPKYQEILKTIIDKQMQAGADGIWIDGFQSNAQFLFFVTKNQDHASVKESIAAIGGIVDWFHAKYPGKFIGSWTGGELPFFAPKFDFVTLPSFDKNEFLGMQINETSWDKKMADASKFGNIPMMTFIDWGWSKGPMYYFSQNLTPSQQSQFLRLADDFFKKKGVIFAYPVHGGFLGHEAAILAYDKYPYYDSIATEFDTYGTIIELVQKKGG